MNLTAMIETGSANPLLLFAFALVLGALHGLEPGHSKTMMAAYIIAIQGTAKQAVLLGLSAAFSHSIIVWVLAILALTIGDELIGETLEPWFIVVSGVIVLAIAAWMLIQAMGARAAPHHHNHDHEHAERDHHHDHDAHGHHHDDDLHAHSHHGHGQAGQEHRHGHTHAGAVLDDAHMDAHARAHAAEIRERLSNGRTGTWQTILFGLSGGLIPCPAAITVFILCLNLGKLALGLTLVSAVSIGLAVTLVAIGVVAAVGLNAVYARTSRIDSVRRAAPRLYAVQIAVIGVVIIWSGLSGLHTRSHVH